MVEYKVIEQEVIGTIEDAIKKADGMIGYFPLSQLYLAKGMTELALGLFPSLKDELIALDCSICRKINDPKYF